MRVGTLNAPAASLVGVPACSAARVAATDGADPNEHVEGVSPSSYSLGSTPRVFATPTADQSGTAPSVATGASKATTPISPPSPRWGPRRRLLRHVPPASREPLTSAATGASISMGGTSGRFFRSFVFVFNMLFFLALVYPYLSRSRKWLRTW